MYRLVIGGVALFCLVSCKIMVPAAGNGTVNRAGSGTAAAAPVDTSGSSKQAGKSAKQVLSVLLQAKGSVAETEWSVKSVQIVDGYVKGGARTRFAGYQAAYFMDGAGNRVDSAFFESPLAQRVEYPTSDDGKLATSIEKSREGVGFVRTNYKEEITELQIYNADGKKTATLSLVRMIK